MSLIWQLDGKNLGIYVQQTIIHQLLMRGGILVQWEILGE
jgi:hypothetical protein